MPVVPWGSLAIRRISLVLAALIGCVAALGGILYVLLFLRLQDNSVDISGALGDNRPSTVPDAAGRTPLNILLIGSDTRSGPNAAYGGVAGARSDTMMLVHLSADRLRATITSIPRDTLTSRPACPLPDGRRSQPVAQAPINTALGVGGPACVVTTIEKITGLRIDHFVQVDFTGFAKLVDAVGGVAVTLPEPINDPYTGLHLAAGEHVLGGEQALAFNRTRHGVGDGSDLARISLQHQFLTALWQKLDAEQLLFDPVRLQQLVSAAYSAITIDSDLASPNNLIDLVGQLRGLEPQAITYLVLPHTPSAADPNRLVPEQPEADQLWERLRTDGPTADLVEHQ